MEFFVSVARPLKEFLTKFQSTAPLTIFRIIFERAVVGSHGSHFEKGNYGKCQRI